MIFCIDIGNIGRQY